MSDEDEADVVRGSSVREMTARNSSEIQVQVEDTTERPVDYL